MTTITLEENKLTVKGHAGFGKVGYDIVCAGISTLIFTFEASIKAHTNDCVGFSFADAEIIAEWQELSSQGLLLLNSFISGCLFLQDEYPENIKVQTLNTLKARENNAEL